jgi:uncharacterized protein YbjT (DUF2867 family)
MAGASALVRSTPVADPVLVLGATGTQGGAVARALLTEQFTVRALVRNPRSERAQALSDAGAALVEGDLRDADSIARAMDGVEAAYAITTPFEGGADDELGQGENIIAAAQGADLPWLILASVAAADRAPVSHFRSKAQIEQQLKETAIPWTVIAPSYFYENVLGSRDAIREGKLPIALPADTPLHQVALATLGALVVAVLRRRDEHLSRRVEVAADAPTPTDMAAAIGVRYERVPLGDICDRSEDLAAMYEFLADEGYGIDIPALRDRYPEVPWTSFANWAASVDWA